VSFGVKVCTSPHIPEGMTIIMQGKIEIGDVVFRWRNGRIEASVEYTTPRMVILREPPLVAGEKESGG